MKEALTIFGLVALSIALSIAAIVAADRISEALDRDIRTREHQIERYQNPSDSSTSIEWVGGEVPVTVYWSCDVETICYDDSAKVR